MRLRYQLIIGFLIIALVNTIGAIIIYGNFKKVTTPMSATITETIPELLTIDNIENKLSVCDLLLEDVELVDVREGQRFVSRYPQIKLEIQELIRQLVEEDEELEGFEEREIEEYETKEETLKKLNNFFQAGDSLYSILARPDQAQVTALTPLVRMRYQEALSALNSERNNETRELEGKRALAYEISNKSASIIIHSGLTGLVLSLFLGIYLSGRISKPVEKITRSMRAYAQGDNKQQIEIITKNELGTLSEFINGIYYELNQHREALEEKVRSKAEKLAQSEEKYKLISNNMTDLISLCDPQGKVTFCTPSVLEILGHSSEEVVGKDICDFIYSDDLQLVIEKKDELIINQAPYNVECRLQHKNGGHLWVETVVKGIFNDQGEITQLQAATRDITARKNAEQALVEALDKERQLGLLKSKFIAMASHQFRTPLTVIQSNIELLKMQARKDEDKGSTNIFGKISSRIQREVSRMTDLMNDVLLLGKINSNQMTKNPESVDMLELVEEFRDQTQSIADNNRTLEVSIHGEPFEVICDRTQLGHSLMNLISNAFKYSAESGRNPQILLNFSFIDHLEIFITDHGIGIPANELSDVFSPFYRADNVGDLPGTGLGLNIVKEYIELNNGTIEVQSEVNEGSTFRISLPRKPKEEQG